MYIKFNKIKKALNLIRILNYINNIRVNFKKNATFKK